MTSETEAQTLLREAGIRVTVPRTIIYQYLIDNRIHPTCDQIFNALKKENPSLSLASVYNVTEKLVDEKLLIRIVDPAGERHYDSMTKFHGHFFCEECGNIYDLQSCPDNIYEELPGSVTHSIDLTVKGICPSCVKKNKRKGNK